MATFSKFILFPFFVLDVATPKPLGLTSLVGLTENPQKRLFLRFGT